MPKQWIASEASRLDSALSTFGSFSRVKAQKIIKDGVLKVNGEVVTKSSFSLKEGDEISFEEPSASEDVSVVEPFDMKIPILYEDDSCLVIDKPAGIAVHPGASMRQDEKTLLSGISFLFQERSIPFSSDSVLVHRLDRETTGCILVAKTSDAHAFLQKQFEERTVEKKYLTIVAGIPSPSAAHIDSPIGRNLTDRTKMSVLKTSISREAHTTYQTLGIADDTALLACDLHTGRTHQIRVHLSSIGHPILGDPTYGSSQSVKMTQAYSVAGMCLHSWKLKFVSPESDHKIDVDAPLPENFKDVMDNVGLVLHP